MAESPRPAYVPGGLVTGPPLGPDDLTLDQLREVVEALRELLDGQRLFRVVDRRG